MKTLLKVLLALIVLVVVAVIGIYIYLSQFLPNVGPAPEITIESTPDRLERGKYLAENVMLCMACHGERQVDLYAQPVLESTYGKGGFEFPAPFGTLRVPNITPAAIGDWTDGEILRAIVSGVNKDGKALFPIMPWHQYAVASEEDIYSLIAFLRSVPAIENEVARSEINFPLNLIMNTMPKRADLSKNVRPDGSDKVALGKYMLTIGACQDCHTPMDDKGNWLDGMYLAGGNQYPMTTGGIAQSLNITPDPETGIGKLSEEEFVHLFKRYTDSSYVHRQVAYGDANTEMPWHSYARMDTSDLQAIYAYLRSVPPINNKVERFLLPSDEGEAN